MIRICMVRGTRLVFSARPHAYTLAASTRKQQRLSSFQRPPAQRHCARISSLAPSTNNCMSLLHVLQASHTPSHHGGFTKRLVELIVKRHPDKFESWVYLSKRRKYQEVRLCLRHYELTQCT